MERSGMSESTDRIERAQLEIREILSASRLADLASPRSEAMSDLGLSWMGGSR